MSKVFDIECHSTRYRSWKIVDFEGHEQDCRYRSFVSSISSIMIRYRALISYTILKAFFTFDIEYKSFDIVQQNIGIDIVYDIAFTQCHSLRSGSSLCPGGITPVPKGLSATRPGFLHPLFAEFHSLIHRDLKRKGPSIAPHPHVDNNTVDFKQPAPSPVVGSWIRCSFPWDLTPEAVRNCIDWVDSIFVQGRQKSALPIMKNQTSYTMSYLISYTISNRIAPIYCTILIYDIVYR